MKLSVRWKRRTCFAVVLLVASLSNCDDPSVPPSNHAPGTITDLRAEATTDSRRASSARLLWTVPPSIDEADPVYNYEARASAEMRGGDEWLSLPSVVLPASRHPGEQESLILRELQYGQRYYFVVRSARVASGWSTWSNVAERVVGNNPPMAAFTLAPAIGCVGTSITVNANDCTDAEDSLATLEVRWDWTDDGVWDTDWSRDKDAVHRYGSRGRHRIRLVVRDSAGETTQVIHHVVIASVEIQRAVRSVGRYEEAVYCTDPWDASSCTHYVAPREERTSAPGPVDLHTYLSEQISTVGGDTLAFDGSVRAELPSSIYMTWSNYDVTFYTCDFVAYRWQGQTNRGAVSLTGSTVLLEAQSDFHFEGVLPPGSYRLRADVINHWANPAADRLTFQMILHPLQEPGDLPLSAH